MSGLQEKTMGVPQNENDSLEQRRDVDERIQTLLQNAGVHSYSFDPVSLEALRDLMQERERVDSDEPSKTALQAPAPTLFPDALEHKILAREHERFWSRPTPATMDRTPPPRSLAASSPDTKLAATVTQTPATPTPRKTFSHTLSDLSATDTADVASDASVAPATNFETRVLEQLHQQTQMLLRLQERVDELYEMVHSQPSVRPPSDNRKDSSGAIPLAATEQPAVAPTQVAGRPEATEPVPPVRNPPAAAPIHIFLKRLAHLQQVFSALRAVYMPNLNAGLLIKVLFMLCVVMARMGAGRRRGETAEESAVRAIRFMATGVAILVGLLIHSGATRFIYYFYVKENYVYRILWEGEEFNLDELVHQAIRAQRPTRPGVGGNAAANEEPQARVQQPPEHGGWPGALLAGRLPRPQEAGVFAPVLEVLIFVFSFFLSIFPHWQPEALPQVNDGRGGGLNQDEEDDYDDDDSDVDQEDGDPREGQLPPVRPPRDAFEPLDDADY